MTDFNATWHLDDWTLDDLFLEILAERQRILAGRSEFLLGEKISDDLRELKTLHLEIGARLAELRPEVTPEQFAKIESIAKESFIAGSETERFGSFGLNSRLAGKKRKYSRKQREKRQKRQTWAGLNTAGREARDEQILADYQGKVRKNSQLTINSFVEKYAARYSLKSRRMREILKAKVADLDSRRAKA
ncbi:hypothetical protein ACHHRT_04065 [Desulfurivibrio sp. D14AmB]|uniref:hypothetical protein n=1 Tax=Desulfurivibrio sp. D14AmB TaxID=3374370 RepID=UPI00376F384C